MRRIWICPILVFTGLFCFHSLKAWGLFPILFPDETRYMLGARVLPFAEAEIPSYLFFAVYRFVKLFDPDFMNAMRILNALFFTLGGVFIYLLARMVCKPALALFLAAASLMLPFSFITAFFMPEALYFFVVWALVWMMVRYGSLDAAHQGALFGAVIGILSLIKVHALFLLPGAAVYIALMQARNEKWSARPVVHSIAALVAVCFSVKLFGNWLFAGSSGVALFGGPYSAALQEGLQSFELPVLLWAFLYNLAGHIVVLGFIYGVPVLFALGLAVHQRSRENNGAYKALYRLPVACLALLPPLVVMAAMFASLNAAASFDYDFSIGELQGRYFSFLFPGFILIMGYAISLEKNDVRQGMKERLWGLAPLACFLYAVGTSLRGYSLLFIPHYPDACVLFSPDIPWLTLGMQLLLALSAVLWLFSRRAAALCFLFAFIPVYIFGYCLDSHVIYRTYASGRTAIAQGAETARELLGDERNAVTIYARKNTKWAYVFLFYLEQKSDRVIEYESPDETDLERMVPGSKWAIILDAAHPPPDSVTFAMPLVITNDPKESTWIYRTEDFSYSVDMADAARKWPVKSVEETDGEIVIRYRISLPPHYSLSLDAEAADGKTGAGYDILVGGTTHRLLGKDDFLRLRDMGPNDEIRIEPASDGESGTPSPFHGIRKVCVEPVRHFLRP